MTIAAALVVCALGAAAAPTSDPGTIERAIATAERTWDLDAALTALAAFDERKSRVVEMKYFGGLSVEETAEVLQVSVITVARDWKLAKAWLYTHIKDDSQHAS